jgi:hypothetical protein
MPGADGATRQARLDTEVSQIDENDVGLDAVLFVTTDAEQEDTALVGFAPG